MVYCFELSCFNLLPCNQHETQVDRKGPIGCEGPEGPIGYQDQKMQLEKKKEEKTCLICLGKIDSLQTLECNDIFCKDCILQYVKAKINENEYIRCPSCAKPLDNNIIEDILKDNSQEYYDYKNSLSYATYICNNCDLRCFKTTPNELFQVYCKKCNIDFCAMCKGPNCTTQCENQIDLDHEKAELENIFEDDVKKCPRCLINLWKEEGCNSVKCPYCKVKFCWTCEKTEHQIKLLEENHDCHEFDGYLDTYSSESDGENVD